MIRSKRCMFIGGEIVLFNFEMQRECRMVSLDADERTYNSFVGVRILAYHMFTNDENRLILLSILVIVR